MSTVVDAMGGRSMSTVVDAMGGTVHTRRRNMNPMNTTTMTPLILVSAIVRSEFEGGGSEEGVGDSDRGARGGSDGGAGEAGTAGGVEGGDGCELARVLSVDMNDGPGAELALESAARAEGGGASEAAAAGHAAVAGRIAGGASPGAVVVGSVCVDHEARHEQLGRVVHEEESDEDGSETERNLVDAVWLAAGPLGALRGVARLRAAVIAQQDLPEA